MTIICPEYQNNRLEEKFPYTCMACPSKFQQLSEAKNHFFLKHQEAKPVDSITEDIGNININKSRPNSDTDSDINCSY